MPRAARWRQTGRGASYLGPSIEPAALCGYALPHSSPGHGPGRRGWQGDIHSTPPGVYMNTNMQEWREETAAIVNELLADGSNPDLDYEIEHHFACQKFDLLEKAAVDLFKAGFEVTDAERWSWTTAPPSSVSTPWWSASWTSTPSSPTSRRCCPSSKIRGGLRRLGHLLPGVSAPDHVRFAKTTRPPSGGLVVAGLLLRQLVAAGKLGRWEGAAEQIALQPIATDLHQPGLLLRCLHPSAVILMPSSWPNPMTERTMAVVAWLVASPQVKLCRA